MGCRYGVAGLAIQRALRLRIAGLANPVRENDIPSARGRQLYRWDRLWRKAWTPVWLVLILLGWFLCK